MRIIVADDHSLMRDILRQYLQFLSESLDIVEASSLPEVLDHRDDEQPADLILLDLQMPGMDGLKSVGEVRRTFPACPIVVISANEDPKTIRDAIQAGANGYIPKTTRGKSVVTALKLVLAGEIYLPPTLLTDMGMSLAHDQFARQAGSAPGGGFAKLSDREAAVLRLLIEGKTNKEIGRDLALQEVTVKVHLRNIYRKIGATNRADAVRLAFQAGWNDASKTKTA